MKNTKKLISIVLVVMMLVSMAVVSGMTTASAATGTPASYYSTNKTGFGKEKTITVDGAISDWDSSMLIAQGTANDDPRVYREASMHENPIDLYALYGAYDSTNLYLMWEMTNVQDVVAPDQNYPLTQGHLYQTENLPFFIVIDTGKSSDAIGNNGKSAAGDTIWNSGLSFAKSFNRMIAISTNGSNGPFIYGGDSSGLNTTEIYKPATAGITFKWGEGIVSDKVYGIDKGFGPYNNRVPGDVCSESSAWVEFNSKGHDSAAYDFHFEMSIPLEKLGITKNDVATNGVGAMVVATYGKSGMDCLPYDLSMNDNAAEPDTESQPGNSFEKSDADAITVSYARIGKQGENPPEPVTDPTQPTDPTDPTDPPTPTTDLTVNATSNYFASSSQNGLSVGNTVTVTYELDSNIGVASAQWSMSYDSSKLRLLTPANSISPVGGVVNADGNPVYGNITCVKPFFDFSGGKTLVQAQFEVLATGTTNVNLTLNELNLGISDSSGITLATVVEDGVQKDVTGQAGFTNAATSGSSETSAEGVITDSLTVNAKSNFFETSSATFDADTGNIIVAYKLKSNKGLVNSQWYLRYDASKLSYVNATMPKAGGTIDTPEAGVVTGNFTGLNMVDYSTMDDFLTLTFKPVGTGTTDVNMTMYILSVGTKSGSEVQETYLVDKGQIKSTSGYTTGSEVYEASFLRGDVDRNGVVDINDATLLQRYLALFSNATLNAQQLLAADANKDGKVNIKDVTEIQRAVAKYIVLEG